MDFKKIKEEDWFEIGECCKKATCKLGKLIEMTQGKFPTYMVKQLENSFKELDKFKKEAKNRMKITAKDIQDYYFDSEPDDKD